MKRIGLHRTGASGEFEFDFAAETVQAQSLRVDVRDLRGSEEARAHQWAHQPLASRLLLGCRLRRVESTPGLAHEARSGCALQHRRAPQRWKSKRFECAPQSRMNAHSNAGQLALLCNRRALRRFAHVGIHIGDALYLETRGVAGEKNCV